jgi:hypothetical protein
MANRENQENAADRHSGNTPESRRTTRKLVYGRTNHYHLMLKPIARHG